MSHHWSEMDPEQQKRLANLVEQTNDQREQIRAFFGRRAVLVVEGEEPLGATGNYPDGKYTDRDEGEIRFAVVADRERRKVLIDFGKTVHSIGMTPEQAVAFGQMLIAKAVRAGGGE